MKAPAGSKEIGPSTDLTLNALLKASPLAIVLLDRDMHVTAWNPAAERMFGWRAEEIIGKPYPLVPDDLSEEHGTLIAALREGSQPAGFSTRRRRKNGTLIDVHILAAPLQDDAGRVESLLGFFADMTEQRRLEAEFRQAQKMEAVGQLAGGIAHDFNNMLTVIGMHCEGLRETVPVDVHRDVQAIENAARRAADLTRQLLAFGRKQVLQPRRLDVNNVVQGIQPMLARLLGEDVQLELRLTGALRAVLADRSQLEQVIVNLAVNARDAMPKGGRLMIETFLTEMDEQFADVRGVKIPLGPYVVLAVHDTGAGMSQETMARIFEPFFTTKDPGKGTGLGLSTVYGIVKQSGGFIWAYSELGEGTTMKVYLPALDETADQATPTSVPVVLSGGTETILVVEDEESVRRIAVRILREHGYDVVPAGSVAEALRVAASVGREIDLLLTDVVLPDGNGPGLAERLAHMKRVPATVFASGYTDDEVFRRGLRCAGAGFLHKPFSSASLLAAVRGAIEAGKTSVQGPLPPCGGACNEQEMG